MCWTRRGTRRLSSAWRPKCPGCAAAIRCTAWGSPPARSALLPARTPMKCPYCKAEDTAVIDSRESEDGDSVRRRRQCEACGKRFTTSERVELSTNRIEQRILALGEREIPSRVIGEMVMRELKKMDDVAYIRFASVYEDFQRVDDFRDAILEVKKPGGKRTRGAAK